MKKSLARALTVAVAAVLVLVIIILSTRLSRLSALREREKEALREKQQGIDSIEHDLTMPEDEFIEKDARESGYHQSGELVFETER